MSLAPELPKIGETVWVALACLRFATVTGTLRAPGLAEITVRLPDGSELRCRPGEIVRLASEKAKA